MSGSSPSISICLPVFNGARFLSAAIESVLAQSHADFEFIISDDCSTDESKQIIENFAAKDARIKVLHNDANLGLFGNYNCAMRAASGEFIKLFAQDDLMHENIVSRSLVPFQTNPSVALISVQRTLVDSEGKQIAAPNGFPEALKPREILDGGEVLRRSLLPVTNFIGEPSTVMFRRDYIGTGFDESFRHLGDLEYWLRILMRGKYAYIPEPLCSFRVHDGSATRMNKRLLLDTIDLLRFGKIYARALSSMESSTEQFYKIAMQSAISESVLAVAESLSLLSTSTGQLSEEADKLVAQVPSVEYFELALRALELVHAEQNGGGPFEPFSNANLQNFSVSKQIDRSGSIRLLELELTTCLCSLSWRLSKGFRELNKSIRASDIVEEEICTKSLEDQFTYENYLKNQIWRIKNSLSWRLTRPIRAVEDKVKKKWAS